MFSLPTVCIIQLDIPENHFECELFEGHTLGNAITKFAKGDLGCQLCNISGSWLAFVK
jgi:hypothetical protein